MSNYSFSQQFYKRWTCAPDPVRTAIIQELTDITTLLQTEQPFESFTFKTHDLDAHIDELYENHHAELAIEKAIADKQAQEVAQQRLQEDELQAEKAKPVESTEDKNDKEQLTKPKNNEQSADLEQHDPSHTESQVEDNLLDNSQLDKQEVTAANDGQIKSINDKSDLVAAIDLSLKEADLSTEHQNLIRELEVQIDDYLSEQMMQMSENLKSWLRSEVAQRLMEQTSSDSAVSAQNNS